MMEEKSTIKGCFKIFLTLVISTFAVLGYFKADSNEGQIDLLKWEFDLAHKPYLSIGIEYREHPKLKDKFILGLKFKNEGGALKDLQCIADSGYLEMKELPKFIGSKSEEEKQINVSRNLASAPIIGKYKFQYFDQIDRKYEQILIISLNEYNSKLKAEFDEPKELITNK